MATWILEQNVFSEKCYDQMVEHLTHRDVPFHVVKVIPFVHEIDGPAPDVSGSVVVYGSIGVQKLARSHGWSPGVFGDAAMFSEQSARRNLDDLYLNYGLMIIKIKKLGANPGAMARVLGGLSGVPLTDFFIKPNTDTKEFAGQVIPVKEFARWYAGMLESGYLDDNDFDVAVSKPKTLGCEWRVVVVDGKISSASLYRQYQRVMPERHILPEVEALVMEAHRRYAPAPVYVIDVAQVGDDFKVIEYNTFNSAGLYECDVAKIIDDINEYLARHD